MEVLSSKHRIIIDLITKPLFIGVGHPDPWDIETQPPNIDPRTLTQTGLQEYFPVIQAAPVIKLSTAQPGSYVVAGGHYLNIEPSWQSLTAANCYAIAFTAVITHNAINSSHYRSIGLYEDITVDNQTDRKLLNLIFFPPVQIQTDLVETKTIIMGW